MVDKKGGITTTWCVQLSIDERQHQTLKNTNNDINLSFKAARMHMQSQRGYEHDIAKMERPHGTFSTSHKKTDS